MSEVIMKLKGNHVKVKGGEYIQDLVRCVECRHRPVKEDADGEDFGFNVIAPEGSSLCPCIVDDGWYSRMPKDDFFCGYGEKSE